MVTRQYNMYNHGAFSCASRPQKRGSTAVRTCFPAPTRSAFRQSAHCYNVRADQSPSSDALRFDAKHHVTVTCVCALPYRGTYWYVVMRLYSVPAVC